jgi:hypothetical protein
LGVRTPILQCSSRQGCHFSWLILMNQGDEG